MSVGGLTLMTGALFALSRMDASCSIVMVAVLCAAQAAGQSLANMPVNTWGINALENARSPMATPSPTPGVRLQAAWGPPSSSRL